MGEIPIFALRSSNKLSRKAPDSNSSMVGGDVKCVYLNPRTRPYYLRRCKRARPADIQSLPDELLSDILTRLPADYIHDVARLVCLRWYHIVHSPDFVRTQIQHSTHGLMLSCEWANGGFRPVLVTATQGGQIETVRDCDYSDDSLYVMNPATKQHLVLPPCSRHFPWLSSCSIAYTVASMEYKVVLPLKNEGKSGDWFLAILTVGVDESWRDVPVKHMSLSYVSLLSKSGIITEGYIHWVMPEFWWVLTLDVETETFTTSTAPLPRKHSRGSCYMSTGKFLSLLVPRRDLSWEVWGMGSRDGEWSKVLPDIDLGAHESRLRERFGIGEDKALRPVGWVKYPEVWPCALGANVGVGFAFSTISRRMKLTGLNCPNPFYILPAVCIRTTWNGIIELILFYL
ncbi:hypothetical protein OROGR_011758 [Orobanche gracilis]